MHCMDSSTAESKTITSFRYDDAISALQCIRTQMIDNKSELSKRCLADKAEATTLKSRCFTFVDPHGHPISTQHLDHESMDVVIKKFRKDYIPGYLKNWVKIGTSIPKKAFENADTKVKSFVYEYPDGQEFFGYGKITAWLHTRSDSEFEPIDLYVQLSNSMEEIKSRIQKSHFIQADLELRSCLIQDEDQPQAEHWKNGQRLQSKDTIMSCKFYEKDQHLLIKVILKNLESSPESHQPTWDLSVLHLDYRRSFGRTFPVICESSHGQDDNYRGVSCNDN